MSLARGEINPLGLLGLRKLHFIPPHFSSISIDYGVDMLAIEDWIEYNLNGRYCIKLDLMIKDNKITTGIMIGLEDQKELTMLTLGCKELHVRKELF